MTIYRASIRHSEDSINAFTRAQFNIFQRKKKAVLYLLTILLLAVGTLGNFSRGIRILCLFGGCLILVDMRYIPRRTAAAMLKKPGVCSEVRYEFSEKEIHIQAENGSTSTCYSSLVRLAEDPAYCFLFLGSNAAYTIDKKAIKPDELTGIKDLVSSGSGLRWVRADGLLTVNLFSQIKGIKNNKNNSRHKYFHSGCYRIFAQSWTCPQVMAKLLPVVALPSWLHSATARLPISRISKIRPRGIMSS